MKRLLLLLLLCATSVYTKDFPKGLNSTKWKQVNTKDNKDYSIIEFYESFYIYKDYKNSELEGVTTYKMSNYQTQGDLLFVWYDDMTYPDIFEIRYDLTKYGKVVLLDYGVDTRDRDSWRAVYIPLVE